MNKEILKLAIPNIISNISVPLLSSVDTALMGHLSSGHLAAVGLSSMLFNFIYWNVGFLRMGTTGLSAQAYGQENQSRMIHTLIRAIIIASLLTIVIVSLQVPLFQLLAYFFNVDVQASPLVAQYYYIRILDAPATLGLIVFMGWYFGMQNAIFPLLLTIFINIINISVSSIFVRYYHWDIAGVAYGTVIAQYAGLLLCVLLFFIRYRGLFHAFNRRTCLAIQEFRQFLNVNKDIFLRTLCLSLCFAFFYSQSNKIDAMTLAVNTVLMQFLNWMSFGVDGFAYAAESLVGKYKGASIEQKTNEAVRRSFVWGMAFALLYSLVYLLFSSSLLSIFTDDVSVIAEANRFMIWIIILPILGTPCYLWDGVFVGLTATKAMRWSMLLAASGFFIALYSLSPFLGNHGLWLALMSFLVLRGLIQSYQYSKKGWNLK